MKKTMIFTIIALIVIILMTAFGISLLSVSPIKVPADLAPNVLYVCPVNDDSAWQQLATNLTHARKPITVGIFFAAMILMAVWMWTVYQNLLKDKFNRDSFKKPWAFTKLLFWCIIILTVLMKSPNYFREVQIDGARGRYVLCENTSQGAKVVKNAQLVHDAKH